MKKLIFIALLAISSISIFGQKLSKDETVAYIRSIICKDNFVKYGICWENEPMEFEFESVSASEGRLYISYKIVHNNRHNTTEIVLDGKFTALEVKTCGIDYYYAIRENCEHGSCCFLLDKPDAERLVKALNYLSTICVDPFK